MLNNYKQAITKARGFLESPQNAYVIDDEKLSKYSLKRQILKLEKQGKTIIFNSLFTKNKKFVQDFHNLLIQNEELKNKAYIDRNFVYKSGDVYRINNTIIKSLGNIEIIYVVIPKVEEVVAILKYQKDSTIYNKDHKSITCTKSLIWKDENDNPRRMSDLIELFYFNELKYKSILSDDLYTDKGKKSLFFLLDKYVNSKFFYFVIDNEIQYQIKSKEDLEYHFAKYFGDSENFAKYKFLLSVVKI